jgi:hypothetical protein
VPSQRAAETVSWRKGNYDLVIGERFSKDKDSTPKHWQVGNVILNKMTTVGVNDTQSGFRGYSRAAFSKLRPSEMGMGIDSELLMQASRLGFRIGEVQVSVVYDLENTTVHNPGFHGLDVLLSSVKHLSIRHPLMFYGIPGVVLLGVALGFWYWAAESYIAIKTLLISVALLATGCTLTGVMLLNTGVILWVTIAVMRGGAAASEE